MSDDDAVDVMRGEPVEVSAPVVPVDAAVWSPPAPQSIDPDPDEVWRRISGYRERVHHLEAERDRLAAEVERLSTPAMLKLVDDNGSLLRHLSEARAVIARVRERAENAAKRAISNDRYVQANHLLALLDAATAPPTGLQRDGDAVTRPALLNAQEDTGPTHEQIDASRAAQGLPPIYGAAQEVDQ